MPYFDTTVLQNYCDQNSAYSYGLRCTCLASVWQNKIFKIINECVISFSNNHFLLEYLYVNINEKRNKIPMVKIK